VQICVVLVLLILDLRDLTEKVSFILGFQVSGTSVTYTGNRFEFSGLSSADAWVTTTDTDAHDIQQRDVSLNTEVVLSYTLDL
jgi:hypothetical protein